MVQCDLLWHDGSPVAASPRQVLRRQLERRRRARLARLRGLGARVHPLRRDLRLGARQELARAAARQRLQRRLLDPRHDDGGAGAARDPARHGGRGHARRGLQGRVQLRPARGQLPLPGGAADGGRPRRLPQRRQGDRLPARQGAHVHAQVRRARGQLVPHPPEPLGGREQPLPGRRRARHERDVPAVHRRAGAPHARADAAAGAERQLLQALRARLVRADRARLGARQPHLRAARGRPRARACASRAAWPAAT